jgi:hypothetical protein
MKIRQPSLTGAAILILIAALIVVTVWLIQSTLNPALIGLLGVIVGAVFGVIGTTVKTIFLDPQERQKTREEEANMLRKALYSQLMHQYSFAYFNPEVFIKYPAASFRYSTYTKAQADPTLFFSMVPDASILDIAFSSFQVAHQRILQLEQEAADLNLQRVQSEELQRKQLEEVRKAAEYVRMLVIQRNLDFDLIKQVYVVTPAGEIVLKDFEEEIKLEKLREQQKRKLKKMREQKRKE